MQAGAGGAIETPQPPSTLYQLMMALLWLIWWHTMTNTMMPTAKITSRCSSNFIDSYSKSQWILQQSTECSSYGRDMPCWVNG